MGIELRYRRITPEEFEKLHNDVVYTSIYFGDNLETDAEIYAYFEALKNSDRYLDLDKYWQSLYFIFTGDFPYKEHKTNLRTWLHQIFMGGTATHWEATYGMVRYFTVSEVQEIAEVLNHICFDELQQRCDRLFDDRESKAYMESHYLNLYNQLCQFLAKAAQEGDMILLSFD